MMSIGVQVEKLDACYDDVDVLDEANVKLAEAAVAVYEALAQIYIDEMKEAGDMFKSILSLPSDITNWRFWAGKFADLAVGAITRHAEDFKAKVTELGQMVDTERIVSKAQEIAKIDWPSPTGGALSGQG